MLRASKNNKNQQQTIKAPIRLAGIGVHKAQAACLTLLPAAADTGIVFKRTDLPGVPEIKVKYQNVGQVPFCSRISQENAAVMTLEHLMAALWATEIDNVEVHLSSEEVPILDGSSAPFIRAIQGVGVVMQQASRRYIRILKTIHVGDDQRFIRLSPSCQFSINFEIDFINRRNMASQSFYFEGSPSDFRQTISSARTFGFMEDAPKMQAAGIALGASLENVVVIQDGAALNAEGFRFEDECVRHKVLDAVGDLYLAGFPMIGAYAAKNAGHEFNAFALKTLMDDRDAWCFDTTDEIVGHYGEHSQTRMMMAAPMLSL